jgi:hypothetical protein
VFVCRSDRRCDTSHHNRPSHRTRALDVSVNHPRVDVALISVLWCAYEALAVMTQPRTCPTLAIVVTEDPKSSVHLHGRRYSSVQCPRESDDIV